MRLAFLLCWMSATAFAQEITVRGFLENGTTAGPGRADQVRLVKLEGMMEPVAVAGDVEGDFTLTFEGPFEQGRFLLQAQIGAAIYSAPVTDPMRKVILTVYESRETAPVDAKLANVALFAFRDQVDIGMFFNLDNVSDPPVTIDPDGPSYTFNIPPGYSTIEANTQRGNMPLKQTLNISGDSASINYPLKPGRTQLMVRSIHPFTPGDQFTIPLPEDQEFLNLLVLPMSLEVSGDGLGLESVEEANDLKLYRFARQPGQEALVLTVTGEAATQRPQEHQHQPTSGNQPRIERTSNILQHYRWWIMGAVLLMLGAFSFFSLYIQR